MEESKRYTINVEVDEKFLENPDDQVIIAMKTDIKDNSIGNLSFGSNHEIVTQELHTALDLFQLWLKQKLSNPEIITKLQELDRLQYGHGIACKNMGHAIATLYHQYIQEKET